MIVKQNLNILFYLKRKKASRDGLVPIYVRITIDGLEEEISLGRKVLSTDWNNELKLVESTDKNAKEINKKITETKVDLQRHFDLAQAKNGLVMPAMVKASYMTPISGQQMRDEKVTNLALGEAIDKQIDLYLAYCERVTKAYKDCVQPGPSKIILLAREKKEIEKDIQALSRKANIIFDDKTHVKTFMLAVNELLLNFMEMSISENRSYTTLEKWVGRKKRYVDFLTFRYKVEDIPLIQLEFSFIMELYKYNLLQHKVIPNTATKYCQCVKDMMNRPVSKGWILSNVFSTYKCSYTDPRHDWLTTQEFEDMMERDFGGDLNLIRNVFMFCCFTGLAYSDVRNLKPENIMSGIDGKKWVSKDRQKTGGDETLPLLPIALQILEQYKDHPLCLRRGRVLPVPTNEYFNRCLKEIVKMGGYHTLDLGTHDGRYFFANEVTYNNGVPLKTIARMLGQNSVRSAEGYVRGNRQAISESMQAIEDKLFNKDGTLKTEKKPGPMEAKIIPMKAV